MNSHWLSWIYSVCLKKENGSNLEQDFIYMQLTERLVKKKKKKKQQQKREWGWVVFHKTK